MGEAFAKFSPPLKIRVRPYGRQAGMENGSSAHDDAGQPLGSRQNTEGSIFIEPQACVSWQSWMNDGWRQARFCIQYSSHAITLCHAHQLLARYYLHLGEISSYPPGYKENASVFCRSNRES
jgi:cellobiose phosphorylase